MTTPPPPRDVLDLMRQQAEIEARVRYIEAKLGIVYQPTDDEEARADAASDDG